MTVNAHAHADHSRRIVLRLFVTNGAPNSRIARENLERLRAAAPRAYAFEVEEIDVAVNPQAALDHGIFLTPALQILEPSPGGLIYGNLSDETALWKLLT
jgi:circadian clock protein KaiB